MNSLNQILIEGNLTRDPEMKYTPKGTAVCTFSIAVNKSRKQGDEWIKEVSFFDITAWTELAENCAKNLRKGRGVRIIGSLKQDRWQDADGKMRNKIYIVADHIVFKPEFLNKNEAAQVEDEPPF